jgi:hypothetical protein
MGRDRVRESEIERDRAR